MNGQMKSFCSSNYCWIGLHSNDNGQTYEWMYGESSYRDPSFESQLNDAITQSEFCAMLDTTTEEWDLHSCNGSQLNHSALCSRKNYSFSDDLWVWKQWWNICDFK
jgi:hypothetical protein